MELEKVLKNTMKEAVDKGLVAGANLLVQKNGREICYVEAGMADQEEENPIRRDTIYRLYSQTKPVTAAAVMILVERGQLDLCQQVSEFLPGFKNPSVWADGQARPAVREVLRALELLGIVKPVPGGGNYITENLDTWLIGPLSILFKLNNGYLRQNQQFRAALEREAAILAARKCTPLDAAELWVILARLDAAEDEKVRGELDRELHKKIAKIADNPMVYSVLAAADQLTENIVSGTRDYIMKKNNSAREVDDQHHRLVEAIINGDAEQAERCMSEHMDTIERYMEEMQKKS